MRIAVALSGQPRTWRHTRQPLSRFFAGHEVEVFFHTWDEVEPGEVDALVAAYAPRAYRVEPRPLFVEEKRRLAERFPTRPPLTVFDMFHSVSASLGLALAAQAEGAGYDLICRTRFDLTYDGAWTASPPAAGCVLTPPGFEPEGGCNDQFALGDPEAMGAYAGVSAWLPEGLEALGGAWFRPEVALGTYLRSAAGLDLRRQAFPVVLLREDQVGRPFQALRDDPMFHAGKHEAWEAFARSHFDAAVAERLDFNHAGRRPLAFVRWLQARPADERRALSSLDWPLRIAAIDQFITRELGGPALDAQRHELIRLICATLIHQMDRSEPMTPEAFVVHALSVNILDMRRALAWLEADQGRVNLLPDVLNRLGVLRAAFTFAPPFDQVGEHAWRVE
ncbi:MAG: hypothetical protein P4L73_08510 [Caulobacteraceae bacterium]|nr:hypothetical protein [Caulobacteraceae bacterium]